MAIRPGVVSGVKVRRRDVTRRTSKADRIRNIDRVMPRLIQKVRQAGFEEKIMANRFRNEGPGWAQLKASTVKSRGSAHPILQRTGRLRRGAIRAVRDTFTEGRPKWNNAATLSKVGVPYAKYHQRGTRKMVARTFLRNPTLKELGPARRYLEKLKQRYINTGKI